MTHFAFSIGFGLPQLALEHQVVAEREAMYRQVRQARVTNAVVLVSGTVGTIRPTAGADLLQNGLIVGDEPVTYALDLPEFRDSRRKLFPGRTFFAFTNGQLCKISDGGSDDCRTAARK